MKYLHTHTHIHTYIYSHNSSLVISILQSFVSFDYPFLSWSKTSRNGWQTSKRERESRVVHPSYDHVTRMAPTASATALNAERDSGTRNVPMPADYARGRREGNHVFYPHFQSVVVCPVGRLVLYYTRPSLVFSLLRSFLFLWSVFSSWFTHCMILILAPNSSLFLCNTAVWRESFDGCTGSSEKPANSVVISLFFFMWERRVFVIDLVLPRVLIEDRRDNDSVLKESSTARIWS